MSRAFHEEEHQAQASASSPAPPPPPAPPLPPQQYGSRAANALVRFAHPFIYASRPPSANGAPILESTANGLRPNMRSNSSPLSPKSTTHKTGIPIVALDISPQRTHAVLAGRDILKTVQVSGSTCVEDFNLRSVIVAYAATHNTLGGAISAKHKDQLAANDVKWSHGRFDTTICTAAANGQIVIYDVTRAGVEFARLHEHVRQVHRVAFNPHQGALLLSGSQDSTMRLWDLRDLAGDRSVMTCRSSYQYPGNNEGIRDLRWSPTNGVEFAAGTDNGVIQRWDFRKIKAPILKVNAHEKTCHSIDWHSDGKHLMSGGADKMVNIWDFTSTDRRKKPCWQIRAPQAVLNVRWRPPGWGAPGRNTADWQCSQIVTSYDHQDPRIHIWDFRRPSMPSREIDCYDTAPTAMLWHSEDLLWSVGLHGIFAQTDINLATQVSDRRSASVVAMAPSGHIGFFSEQRSRRRRSLQDASEDYLLRQRKVHGGGEKMSRSHSATDGSFEEASLLSSSFKNRHRKLTSSRSSKSIAGTPPSVSTGGPVVRLDEALQKEFVFRPGQVAAYGHVIGLFEPAAFAFLARNYKISSLMPSTQLTNNWARKLSDNFQSNAKLAARTHEYRLAQSWRILGLSVEKEFQAWMTTHGSRRPKLPSFINVGKQSNHGNTRSDAGYTGQIHERSMATSETTKQRRELTTLQTLGNSSNMTTPIARSIADTSVQPAGSECTLTPAGDAYLSVPPPAAGESQGQSQTYAPSGSPSRNGHGRVCESFHTERKFQVSGSSPTGGTSFVENADFHVPQTGFSDLDHYMSERRAAIENFKATPRPLLRLEESAHTLPGNNTAGSADGFQLFSASTDSSREANSLTSSGSSQCSEKLDMIAGRWQKKAHHGKGHGDSQEKLVSNKDQTLEDSFPLFLGGADHSDQVLSSHSPINVDRPQRLGSSPLYRPHPKHPVIHLDDMESFGEFERPELISCRDSTPRYEASDYEQATPDMIDACPWAAASMINSLIRYHTAELCSSQMPANILLQLGPLSNSVAPALVLSTLLSYHAQLTSLSLHVQAADLRNHSYPLYPDVSDHGSYGISPGGPWCTVCQKPSKGNRQRFCQRCNQPWADCPICNGEGTAAVTHGKHSRQFDSLWGWCQWCGHGGHTGCLRVWWEMFETSEGGCATAGCLHDCVAGVRREVVHKRKAAAKKASTVKGDEWVVGESRAVERTRSMVYGPGEDGGSHNGFHHGAVNTKSLRGAQGPLSLGLMGRSGSGGKKVRLLVPIDDGHGRMALQGGGGGSGGEGGNGTSASAP